MKDWSFSDWITNICLAIAALNIAVTQTKFSLNLKVGKLRFLPISLLGIALLSFAGGTIYKLIQNRSDRFHYCSEDYTKMADETNKWFREAAENNSRLGQAISNCIEIIDNASKMRYENSTTLWIGQPKRVFYVIAAKTQSWFSFDEGESCRGEWCDDRGPGTASRTAAKLHFKKPLPPSGKRFPIAGIAEYISNNPIEWSKFGYLQDQCEIEPRLIHRMMFENGIVLGIYPQWNGASDGEIITLLSKEKSAVITLTGETKGADCRKFE